MMLSVKSRFSIVFVSIICAYAAIVKCQTEVTNATPLTATVPKVLTWGNSRISKIIGYHAYNVRQFFCRRGLSGGITPEEWAKIKTECIAPRIKDLIPDNMVKVWQQCSQLIVDLCDDKQWSESKTCGTEALANENVQEIRLWYRGKLRQINQNVQQIRMCAKNQRQKT